MATLKCTVQRSTYYEVYFEYSYTQDKANAKTNLTHALKLKQLTDGYDFNTVAAVTVSYSVAGQAFSKTAVININDKGNKGYTITLASGSSTITHNSSTGVGSFAVSVNTTIESGGYGPGKITLSKTVDLPTIYRASVPTVVTAAGGLLGTVTMGDLVYINTNRKSSSFTHTIKYDFAGRGAAISNGVGGSYAWNVPDIAQYCNNATSAKATITCITYNGSEKVGEEICEVTIKVPEATNPMFTNGDVIIGHNNPITTNARSSNFTHLITYSFNGATGSVNTDKLKSGIVWQTPAALAGKITTASGNGTITCTTYNGTAVVGSKTMSFKAVVPNEEHFQPTVEFSFSPSGSLPEAFNGYYIQGKTGVTARFTAESEYSEIDSYKLIADGRNYTGNPATSLPFARPGVFTVTGIVTDKRGFSTTVTQDVTVYAYSTPSIDPYDGHSSIVCERSTQDKTYDDAGTHLHVKGKRRYSPFLVNAEDINFCSVKYQYKVQGGSWSDEFVLMSEKPNTTHSFDVAIPNVVTQTEKAYSIRLIVTDTIGSREEYEFSIPTADVALHLGYGGYGVAVGKYSAATPDQKMFEVADDWDLVMKGKAVADFVVEQGTSGAWAYRKWNSGRVELYGFHVADVAVNVDLGSVYRSAVVTANLPFAVYDITVVADCCDINAWASSNTYWTSEGVTTVSYLILRGAALDTYQAQTHIHINGRWK